MSNNNHQKKIQTSSSNSSDDEDEQFISESNISKSVRSCETKQPQNKTSTRRKSSDHIMSKYLDHSTHSQEFEPKPSTSSAPDYTPPFENVRSRRHYESPSENCAVLSYRRTDDGQWHFHPNLIKYFMKLDSPDYRDLKAGKRNTSFLHEIPRGDRDIEIFTPEDDKNPKYELPKVKCNVTSGEPGVKYVEAFRSLPGISPVVLDDDFKKGIEKMKRDEKKMKIGNKKHSRTRIGKVSFKGGPLPDHALCTHYDDFSDSDFSLNSSDEIPTVNDSDTYKLGNLNNDNCGASYSKDTNVEEILKPVKSNKRQKKCGKSASKGNSLPDDSLFVKIVDDSKPPSSGHSIDVTMDKTKKPVKLQKTKKNLKPTNLQKTKKNVKSMKHKKELKSAEPVVLDDDINLNNDNCGALSSKDNVDEIFKPVKSNKRQKKSDKSASKGNSLPDDSLFVKIVDDSKPTSSGHSIDVIMDEIRKPVKLQKTKKNVKSMKHKKELKSSSKVKSAEPVVLDDDVNLNNDNCGASSSKDTNVEEILKPVKSNKRQKKCGKSASKGNSLPDDSLFVKIVDDSKPPSSGHSIDVTMHKTKKPVKLQKTKKNLKPTNLQKTKKNVKSMKHKKELKSAEPVVLDDDINLNNDNCGVLSSKDKVDEILKPVKSNKRQKKCDKSASKGNSLPDNSLSVKIDDDSKPPSSGHSIDVTMDEIRKPVKLQKTKKNFKSMKHKKELKSSCEVKSAEKEERVKEVESFSMREVFSCDHHLTIELKRLSESEIESCIGENKPELKDEKICNLLLCYKHRCETSKLWINGTGDRRIVRRYRRCMPFLYLSKDLLYNSTGSMIEYYPRCRLNGSVITVECCRLVSSKKDEDITRYILNGNIVFGRANGEIGITKKNNHILNSQRGHSGPVYSLDSKDQIVVSGSKSEFKLWRLEDDKKDIVWQSTIEMENKVLSMALMSNNRDCVVGSDGRFKKHPLKLYDIERGEFVMNFGSNFRNGAGILDICIENNNCFLTGGYDTYVQLWDRRCSQSSVAKWTDPYDNSIYCVRSDHHTTIVSGASRNSVVHIWDKRMTRCQYIFMFNQFNSPVYSVAFDASNIFAALDLGVVEFCYLQPCRTRHGLHYVSVADKCHFCRFC